MGQKLSQTKVIDINVYMNKYHPNYSTIKVLNNGIMNKTVLLLNEGIPQVAKIFFKSEYNPEGYKSKVEEIKETQNKLMKKMPSNIAPLIFMEESIRTGIIFRQYLEYNLKERIYLMPYLNNIEKIWISFQILYAVYELSELGIFHGDLKPENILLTSNLSVYISDIATYKPAYISMDDLGNYTYFFGTNRSDNLQGCYFAPERLLDKGENLTEDKKNSKMDVFSAGVIIAELFVEKTLFDLSKLLNYKKGNDKLVDIDEILIKIPENIRNIIYEMIKVDPLKRINIKDVLIKFSNEICPITMSGFLLHFNTLVNSSKFWRPDLIIGLIYRYWIPLWKMIYGPDETPPILYQHLNLAIINKIILFNPLTQDFDKQKFRKENDYIYLNMFKFFFDPENGVLYNNSIDELKEKYNINHNKDCVLVLLNFILQNFQNTKYESTNLVALEIVKNLSTKLSDITKLQLIIPYFVENLHRENFTTKIISLNFLFEILYSFDFKELILPVTEYNYFESYIFPSILEFYESKKPELILEFFNNIDKIIDLQEKFLNITLKARLIKMNQMLKNNDASRRNSINDRKYSSEEKRNSISENFYEERKSSSNNEKINVKKDRRDEIFRDYDTSIEEFKNSLFRVIRDLIGDVNVNDIDILISVIRKLPKLFFFYGRGKTADFSMFITNNFNKQDWIIQKEILCHIPEMMTTLGENTLAVYILSCMEMLIENNSNELKAYELIKSIHQLLKMQFLRPKDAVQLFIKLRPYLIHPNLLIKNEMINFLDSLLKCLTPEETFAYLYQPLSGYLTIPPVIITTDTIKNYCIERLNRIVYQLEFRKKDEKNTNIQSSNTMKINDTLSDNENKFTKLYEKQLELFKELIEKQKIGNLLANDNEEINYSYNGSKEKDPSQYLDTYKKYSLKEPIEKYIKKAFENSFNKEDEQAIQEKILYKIFYLSGSTDKYSFPYIKDNTNCSFKTSSDIMNSELFNVFYILKTLEVSVKSEDINELLHTNNNTRSISNNQVSHILANFNFNKNFNNWRPQGQIVTTLYDHDKAQVEKLLALNENKFCSFDNEGSAIIWQISQKENDESIIVKKIWSYNNENQNPIKYKNTITMVDNLIFVTASGNKMYQYDPKYTNIILNEFCKSDDESDITCVKPFGNNSSESQKILMGTEKGNLYLYDPRIKNVALKKNIPLNKGMINCISETYNMKDFFIGTLGGHMLEYDIRLNSIINDYVYYNNIPILGILPCRLTKNSVYDLSSLIKCYDYYYIWTGAYDHEIGLFNDKNLNCDLLLKVNTIANRKEIRPLTVEIPSFRNESKMKKPYYIYQQETKTKLKKEFNSIIKFTHKYNNNFIKNLVLSNIQDKILENSYDILSNLTNLYDNPSTVQCVASPLCDYSYVKNQRGIEYENCSYLLSAGNDMTIRYWDITREGLNNNEKKSYIINAPNNITYCNYSKSSFDKTNILQSNEAYNEIGQRSHMAGFSTYQNLNGVSFHFDAQYEFDDNLDNLIKYCSRISDCSHKSIITDLLPISVSGYEGQFNVLASCSWDGKIKIWK